MKQAPPGRESQRPPLPLQILTAASIPLGFFQAPAPPRRVSWTMMPDRGGCELVIPKALLAWFNAMDRLEVGLGERSQFSNKFVGCLEQRAPVLIDNLRCAEGPRLSMSEFLVGDIEELGSEPAAKCSDEELSPRHVRHPFPKPDPVIVYAIACRPLAF